VVDTEVLQQWLHLRATEECLKTRYTYNTIYTQQLSAGYNKSTETADLCQGESSLDDFQYLVAIFLSKNASMIKFSLTSHHFFQKYKTNSGKMPHLTMLKNLCMTSKI